MGAFKGWQSSRKNEIFAGFPNIITPNVNPIYGFNGCKFWLNSRLGLDTGTDGALVNQWTEQISGIIFRHSLATNQPSLILDDPAFNLNPSLNFSRTSNNVMSSPYATTFFSRGNTLFLCYRLMTLTNINCMLCLNNNYNSRNVSLGGNNGPLTGVGTYANGSTAYLASNDEELASKIVIISSNLTNSFIMINGITVKYGNNSVNIPFTHIGSTQFGTTAPRARIADIGLFDNALTESDALRLSDNMNNIYAIY